jgi:hypothetical protein
MLNNQMVILMNGDENDGYPLVVSSMAGKSPIFCHKKFHQQMGFSS